MSSTHVDYMISFPMLHLFQTVHLKENEGVGLRNNVTLVRRQLRRKSHRQRLYVQ